MKILTDPEKLEQALAIHRRRGKRIGFVPTMGCLHAGHLSLVQRALAENDIVVVSIFVNPIQFGPNEDFKRYPRPLDQDKRFLRVEGIDFLFLPSAASIYPTGFKDFVAPGRSASHLCGARRRGHFRGVATVVHRFFQIVRPDTAYFGDKDYQQIKVVEEMARVRHKRVHIVSCPLVRDQDGVALSSRNRYLSDGERMRARALFQALLEARRMVRAGIRKASDLKAAVRNRLSGHVTNIDYVEIVEPRKCVPVSSVRREARIAIACFIGKTRLIDNLLLKV